MIELKPLNGVENYLKEAAEKIEFREAKTFNYLIRDYAIVVNVFVTPYQKAYIIESLDELNIVMSNTQGVFKNYLKIPVEKLDKNAGFDDDFPLKFQGLD